jgi:hypothetical protein
MTRTELKLIVQKKTENKLVGQVDYDALISECEQEFCSEHRYWWRHKEFTFPTVAGTDTYDLSDTSVVVTTPTGAGPFVEEITHITMEDAGNIADLDPVFDDHTIAAWDLETTQDKPGVWTISGRSLTSTQILRLHKVPSGVFVMHVAAWMMPNPAVDTSDDVIYIIPPIWHHALQTCVEKEIWRMVYGEEDPKYVTALNLYNKKVAAAKKKPSFSTQREQFFSNQQEEAIRSTR